MPFELAEQTRRGFSAWSVKERKLIAQIYDTVRVRGQSLTNNELLKTLLGQSITFPLI